LPPRGSISRRPCALDPGHAEAHQGLAYVLAELGDEAGAEEHRRLGFQDRAVRVCRIAGRVRRYRCCCWFLRWAATFPRAICWTTASSRRTWYCPSFTIPKMPLPPHQVVFNAIGDADLAAPPLAAAQSVVALSQAPVINLPSAVLATGRADHARLARLPGVVMPLTVTLPRDLLLLRRVRRRWRATASASRCWCALPDFTPAAIFCGWKARRRWPARWRNCRGRKSTVIEFLDARGADGKVRKYRAMMIDGEIYPLHVAISSQWKIHYFTAEMAERADHRAEDAEFLENMPGCSAARHGGAGAYSSHARPGLRRHRFRPERHRRCFAFRGECHHGGESARA
jgi:hypothetical protein